MLCLAYHMVLNKPSGTHLSSLYNSDNMHAWVYQVNHQSEVMDNDPNLFICLKPSSLYIYRSPHPFCTQKKIGAPYGDVLEWTQPLLKYLSSCKCTSASSDGNILYCSLLGRVLPGNNSILCLILRSCSIDGSSNISANSVHKLSQW